MATISINVDSQIHAEIKGGNKSGLVYSPIILDPITKSYSNSGKLISYVIAANPQTDDTDILQNGKNSRFIATVPGDYIVELTVEDDKGNSDTDTITITII